LSASPHRRLQVLVLTNHFKWFAGSEIVALDTARGFLELGDEVTLAANVIAAPMADHAAGIALTDEVAALELSAFDLVWCQHDLLSLLPVAAFERASVGRLPHIASVSLSPFEPYEYVDGFVARALSADVYANSPETADAIALANAGILERADIHVFYNAAPSAFWRPLVAASQELRSILLVSNHPPAEIDGCAAILESQGVSVRRLGIGHDVRLIQPEDLAAADAVVSIGKSIAYALAMGKPAFVYDHFGGDGWLTRDNFEINRHFNFSGRPHRRRLTGLALAAEIVEGYSRAQGEVQSLAAQFDLSPLRLERHIAALRQRAISRDAGLRQLKLSFLLTHPTFRAHLETSRRKSEVMRALRRQIELPPR
jgi:hypothetical protein